MLANAFILLVVYQLKHFLADYPLQGQYMLGKFKPGWDFLGPLAAHCGVHALMTFVIALSFLLTSSKWDAGYCIVLATALADFDFIAHFAMDRIKAGPKWLGRFKALSGPEYMALLKHKNEILKSGLYTYEELNEIESRFSGNVLFWWALGLDQMWHHLTHYAIIFVLLNQ